MAANKDSFDYLIAKIKHVDSPQTLSVKREMFSEENLNSHEAHITENNSTIRNNEKNNFLSPNSANPYIEDSDSNATCPLQIYSSTDPMKFLTVEMSSSNDSIEQSAVNHDTPKRRRKTNPISFNSVVNTENLSLENTLIHEKINFNNCSEESDLTGDRMDIDAIDSVSEYTKIELENRKSRLNFAENSRSDLKCNPEKYIEDSESRDSWQEELCDKGTDSIVQSIERLAEDNETIEDEDEDGK